MDNTEPRPLHPAVQGALNLVLGSTAFVLVYALVGEKLIPFLAYVALPVILLQFALGKISIGTLQTIFNGDLQARVKHYVDDYARAADPNWKPAQAETSVRV